MSVVFIGVGSNLGDRAKNIAEVIGYLRSTKGVVVDKVSSFIETEPQGAQGPNYLNGVIKIKTDLLPQDLLSKLQEIEERLGRLRPFKNAPRSIDLDILLYDDEIIDELNLKVPHSRMFAREFVLNPLFEIEPEIRMLVENFRNKICKS